MENSSQAIGYGICRLSVAPVRAQPAEAAEQVTQLLYGDHYQLLERHEKGDWLKIRIAADGYVGWLGSKLHTAVQEDFYEELEKHPYTLACGELCGLLRVKESAYPLVYGSLLPFSDMELFSLDPQMRFEGKVLEMRKINSPDVLKTLAMPYLNAPYQWGGKSPFGIDCSGFTQMVYRLAGYSLKRDASQQITQGKTVPISNAQTGDLAFFTNEAGRITHVGLMLDNSRIMHASGKVRIDTLDEQGIINADSKQYTHQLNIMKRIIH